MISDLFVGLSESASANWWYVAAVSGLTFFVLGLLAGKSVPATVDVEGRSGGRVRRGACELYVGNLAYELTEKELRKAFEPFGKVLSTRIIASKSSGASKGYGFVQMADAVEAKAAIRGLNSQKVRGRRLIVSEARSQAKSN